MHCWTKLVGTIVVWLVVSVSVFAVTVIVVIGDAVGIVCVGGTFSADFAVVRESLYELLDVVRTEVAVVLAVAGCLGLGAVGAGVIVLRRGVEIDGGVGNFVMDRGTFPWVGVVGLSPIHVVYKNLYILLS